MKRIPKLRFLLQFVFTLTMAACSSEDEVTRQDLLSGVWIVESAELSDYTVTINSIELNRDNISTNPFLAGEAQDFEALLETLTDDLFPAGTTITFNDDNTYALANANASGTITDTWTLSADEQQIVVQLGDDDTVDDDLDELVFNISELTETSLTLLLSIGEDDLDLSFEDDDLELTIDNFTIEYLFTFNKQ